MNVASVHLGGTKALSTSTRCKVGRPAVKELAPFQQAPEKLHVETWAGCTQGLDLKISQDVQANRLVCCHGRDQAVLLGRCWGGHSWRKSEVRGLVVRACLERGEYVLPFLQRETGSRRDRTPQRGLSPCVPHVLAHMRMGKAQLSGHKLGSGAGHCSLDCGGLSHP